MNSKLYVGNLSFNTTENGLRTAFEQFGSVSEIVLPSDRDSGRPRGFAFVTLGSAEESQRAIEAMNGKELDGRALTVNEARPKEQSAGRSFGGDRRESRNRY